jgi:hypothetical protein
MTSASPVAPIKIRCLLRDQLGHILPVLEHLGNEALYDIDERWDPTAITPQTTDLVVCVNDFAYELTKCIDQARIAGIPSLTIQDGTLEWRCQYDNPMFSAGNGAPQHQPVLTDKIACLGALSARHIAAWGNADKVEVTGMPRLDNLVVRQIASRRPTGRDRVLVMTAKKPWFDETQRLIILRSLREVRDYLAARPEIDVVWRLTKKLEDELGVRNTLTSLDNLEIVQVLEGVDAVITTPSTAILEAMLCGKPVAALDYFNTPRFLPTAWTISASEHIAPIVEDLLEPPAPKLAFQRTCLRDALHCDGTAAPRVAELVRRMSALGRSSRARGDPLRLPANLLGTPGTPFTAPPPFDLAAMYPDQPVYRIRDASELQVRLMRAEKDLERLKASLSDRTLGFWLASAGRFFRRRLKRLA